LKEAKAKPPENLNRGRRLRPKVQLRQLSKVHPHQQNAAGRQGEDSGQVQLPANLVVRRPNRNKVDIKGGVPSKWEHLLLRARLHTRAGAEDTVPSKLERRLRLAWLLKAELEDKVVRLPPHNRAAPQVDLRLDPSVARENPRVERKRAKRLRPRPVVLRQDSLN
jgi:hypothetical protein